MAYKRKADQRRAAQSHYQKNKAIYVARARVHTAKTKEIVAQAVLKHLRKNPCVGCGESDPVVLEFDHRDRDTKAFNIGDALRRGYSLTRVLNEIAKCDVRCANCHRRKTYVEFGRKRRG